MKTPQMILMWKAQIAAAMFWLEVEHQLKYGNKQRTGRFQTKSSKQGRACSLMVRNASCNQMRPIDSLEHDVQTGIINKCQPAQ